MSLGSSVTIGFIVLGAHRNNHGTLRENWILRYIFSQKAVADPGEAPAPLFLDQTEARRAGKKKLKPETGRPPYLRVWMNNNPPPHPPHSQPLVPPLNSKVIV